MANIKIEGISLDTDKNKNYSTFPDVIKIAAFHISYILRTPVNEILAQTFF